MPGCLGIRSAGWGRRREFDGGAPPPPPMNADFDGLATVFRAPCSNSQGWPRRVPRQARMASTARCAHPGTRDSRSDRPFSEGAARFRMKVAAGAERRDHENAASCHGFQPHWNSLGCNNESASVAILLFVLFVAGDLILLDSFIVENDPQRRHLRTLATPGSVLIHGTTSFAAVRFGPRVAHWRPPCPAYPVNQRTPFSLCLLRSLRSPAAFPKLRTSWSPL